MPTPKDADSLVGQRPPLLTAISIFGIVFAVLFAIAMVHSLYQLFLELMRQFPGVPLRSIVRMLAFSRFGALVLILIAATGLRMATPIGLLYMRRWAYRCFMIIVSISLLLFLYAISYEPRVSMQAGGIFVVEAAIFYYLHTIKARLR